MNISRWWLAWACTCTAATACSKSESKLSLKPVQGSPVVIKGLSVEPSKSELSGRNDLRFPGESLEHNGLNLRGQLVIREPVPPGHALLTNVICSASSFAVAKAVEQKVQVSKGQPFVSIDTIDKGDSGVLIVSSPLLVPELGAATTCEVQFRYQPRGISVRADAKAIDLGTVCASPTELRKGPCPEASLTRSVKSGASVWVSPPVGRLTEDKGGLYWLMVTANQTISPITRVWTREDCRGEDGKRHVSAQVHNQDTLDHLAAGESIMIDGFVARPGAAMGACEIHVGLHEQADESLAETHGANTAATEDPAMFTYCMTGEEVREGPCEWPVADTAPGAALDAGPPSSPASD